MTGKPRFELFAYWRTSAAYRVRVTLNLKGIDADERFIDIDAGEHRGDAFLRITLADICLASIKVVLPIFKIEVPDTPIIDRIFAACEAQEAFAKAAPMRQVGAPG